MIVTMTTHAEGFTLAAMLIPKAKWVPAQGDVGQVSEEDVAMEDTATDAVLVLHADGTATLSHTRLLMVTPHLRG